MKMQSQKVVRKSRAGNKENEQQKPIYQSQLSKLGISRLKSLINYNKHLEQLRSQQNPGHLKQSISLKSKFQQSPFPVLQSYFEERERPEHGKQIKFSQAFSFGNTKQLMQKGQMNMDNEQLLLSIYPNQQNKRTTSKTNNSNKLIQNIVYKEPSIPSNNYYFNNQQQLDISKHLEWGASGLNLNIVTPLLLQKINSIYHDNECPQKTDKSVVKLKSDKNRKSKYASTYAQQNKQKTSIIKQESQSLPRQSILSSQQNQIFKASATENTKNKSKAQNDLQKVFQNYKTKKKALGKNKKFMTDQREEAIFTNQLMKVALKYDSLDEFTALSQIKKQKIQALSLNKTKQKKEMEIKQRQTKLFTIGEFKQTYKHVLTNIHNLITEKL